MLDSLPQDQAALILERLGEARVERLSEDCPDAGVLYRRCVREMGRDTGGQRLVRIPNRTKAWIEVTSHNGKMEMPEFSHPAIEKTVMSFGGWVAMVDEFRPLSLAKAKGRFQYAYDGVIGDE